MSDSYAPHLTRVPEGSSATVYPATGKVVVEERTPYRAQPGDPVLVVLDRTLEWARGLRGTVGSVDVRDDGEVEFVHVLLMDGGTVMMRPGMVHPRPSDDPPRAPTTPAETAQGFIDLVTLARAREASATTAVGIMHEKLWALASNLDIRGVMNLSVQEVQGVAMRLGNELRTLRAFKEEENALATAVREPSEHERKVDGSWPPPEPAAGRILPRQG